MRKISRDFWGAKDVEDVAAAAAMMNVARPELRSQYQMWNSITVHRAELIAIDPVGLGSLLTALTCWQRTTVETVVNADRLRSEAETRVARAEQSERALSEFVKWCNRRRAREMKRKISFRAIS